MAGNTSLSDALEMKDFDVLFVLESGFNVLGVCVGAFLHPCVCWGRSWSWDQHLPARKGTSIVQCTFLAAQ